MLACVVCGLTQLDVQPGDSALVFGAGPMGILVAQSLKQAGAARVVVTDVVPWSLELAARLGASETVVADARQEQRLKGIEPGGYDIVADATGVPAVLEGRFSYARSREKSGFSGYRLSEPS